MFKVKSCSRTQQWTKTGEIRDEFCDGAGHQLKKAQAQALTHAHFIVVIW